MLDIIGKEVAEGCVGRGGTFKANGIFEVDLNHDGLNDLMLAHQSLECNGNSSLSTFCGTQVCSVKIFLKSNTTYRLEEEFLAEIVGYSWSPEIKLDIIGHGGNVGEWKPNYSKPKKVASTVNSNTRKLEVPVLERGAPGDLPTCTSSTVAGLKSNGFLAVRTGPGTNYSKIDELYNGEVVYVFDSRGKWAGIVYRDESVTCSSKKTRKIPNTNKGWVHRNWLRDLAG